MKQKQQKKHDFLEEAKKQQMKQDILQEAKTKAICWTPFVVCHVALFQL